MHITHLLSIIFHVIFHISDIDFSIGLVPELRHRAAKLREAGWWEMWEIITSGSANVGRFFWKMTFDAQSLHARATKIFTPNIYETVSAIPGTKTIDRDLVSCEFIVGWNLQFS